MDPEDISFVLQDSENKAQGGKRSRKTSTWSREETLSLIEYCEVRPCLWDPSLEDYKNRNIRTKYFAEISDVLKKDMSDVKNKWQNLRSQFNAERRKSESNSSGSAAIEIYKSKWEYFALLTFLLPASADTPGISALDIAGCQTVMMNWDEVPEIPQPKKRKVNVENPNREALLQAALKEMLRPADSAQILGDFVADQLRKLKGKRQVIVTKKIMKLLMDEMPDEEFEGGE